MTEKNSDFIKYFICFILCLHLLYPLRHIICFDNSFWKNAFYISTSFLTSLFLYIICKIWDKVKTK